MRINVLILRYVTILRSGNNLNICERPQHMNLKAPGIEITSQNPRNTKFSGWHIVINNALPDETRVWFKNC